MASYIYAQTLATTAEQITYIFHDLFENSGSPVVDIPTINKAYEYLKSVIVIHPNGNSDSK